MVTEIKQKYTVLSEGKKRLLIRKYTQLHGCIATFYNKINGKVKMRKIEQHFFSTNL